VVIIVATGVSPAEARIQPAEHTGALADPSVVPFVHGFVAVGTGIGAPRAVARSVRGPWHRRPAALVAKPRWATGRALWASDMVRIHHRWLLYFSAPVRGLGRNGRCIGVATARSPLGRFHSVGRRPMVCPPRAATPLAQDPMQHRGRHLPVQGVIDPSGFRGRHGHRYLVYKTRGYPSSIRIVRLNARGTHVMRHRHSRTLIRRPWIVENPVLVQRRRHVVLITSEGNFDTCGYHTTWRRARHLGALDRARAHVLVRHHRRGLCGPGGADVVTRPHRPPLVFMHAWTCWRSRRACPGAFRAEHARRLRAHRSLFIAHLRWTPGGPRLRGFVRPRR
jgi:hypothetical protein